uniref:Ig-like domain-containing protein n=1 Tax=Poecilia mexicana TaxID=48701 RepID=A0A3B3XWQ9_9TELE
PASVTLQPGQRLTISCQVSYSTGSYYTAWIRQPAGKGLEWIGMKHGTGDSYYKESLKNKFSIDAQSSSKTVTLNGQNVQPEDSAVYYCARYDHSDTNKLHGSTKTTNVNKLSALTVQPGQSLTISCQVSYSLDSYATFWIRQAAGKTLEWIGAARTGYTTSYNNMMKNKFSITLQDSSKTVTLNGQNMQHEDSGVYYCARASQ